MPRAFVVGAQRRVDDAYAAITAEDFDARRERRRRVGQDARGRPGSPGPAQILHTENDRQVLEIRTTRPGVLVVTDAWAPGWHAVMGGEELKVERVDYLYRGVRVPAGTHIVEFTYRPLSWRIGWIVSLAAFGAARARGGRLAVWPTAAQPTPRPRRRELDGVRAIAALLVLVFHAVGFWARGSGEDAWIRPWVGRLDVGVAVFFLLSGYLLYGLFLRGRIRIGAYAWRRALRIVPAYWVALTVAALVLPLHEVWRTSRSSSGSRRSTGDSTAGQGLGQAWTLCVEVAVLRVPAAVGARCSPDRARCGRWWRFFARALRTKC